MKLKYFLIIIFGITLIFMLFFREVLHGFVNVKSEHTDMLITFTDTLNQVNYILKKNTQNKILYRSTLSGYPTALLSGDSNLFITDKDSEGRSQLFKVDIKTKIKKQLTSQFQIVDLLQIDEKKTKIYMRVLLKGQRNFHIATYDLLGGEIKVWNSADEDNSIQYFNYGSDGRVIAITYSISEDYANVEEANTKQVPLKPSTHQIVMFDNNGINMKVLCSLKKNILDVSISPSEEHAIFTVTEVDQKRLTELTDLDKIVNYSLYRLDVNSGNYNQILSDNNKFYKMQQPTYSLDEQGFYFIAIPFNSKLLTSINGVEARQKSIFYYNLNSGEITEYWNKENGIINNFMMVKI
jgi:Tol biopolymer transport system component